MYCTTCGAKNAADNNFCRQCGQKLDKSLTTKISEDDFDRAKPEDEKVAALLERAYQLRKDNDLPGAIALCEEVLKLRSDSTTAHSLLGQLYEQSGSREKAISQYERVLQLNPGSIADRVKLDQLRDAAAPPVARQSPRVVLVDHNGAPLRGGLLWGLGLGLLLLLSGGVLALLLRPHAEDSANSRSGAEKMAGGNIPLNSASSVPNKAGDSGAGMTSGSENKLNSQPALTNNAAGMSGTSGMPPYGYTFPPVQYVLPQQGVNPRAMNTQPPVTPVPITRPTPASKNRSAANENSADPDSMGSERVHLEGDSDPHNVVIHVSSHNEGKTDKVERPGGKTEPETPGIIKINGHKETGDAASSNPPTSESSALISVAQEKLNKMDYAGAITAFSKALAGANDEAGYVYEKMGECYRQRNENKNAIASYEHGVEEFKKLLSAGRQAERAHDGIRICENGIKICSSE